MSIRADFGLAPALSVAVLVAGMLCAPTDARALDVLAAQRLARQSGCLECHSVYQKKIGPAWKDVAAKYHDEADAARRLYLHLTTGRKAKFSNLYSSHPPTADRVARLRHQH